MDKNRELSLWDVAIDEGYTTWIFHHTKYHIGLQIQSIISQEICYLDEEWKFLTRGICNGGNIEASLHHEKLGENSKKAIYTNTLDNVIMDVNSNWKKKLRDSSSL